MNRTRKYLIILLTLLTALLCAVGASTWIISSPTTFMPGWEKAKIQNIYVNEIVETDLNDNVTGSIVSKKLQFCYEDGNDASAEITQVILGIANSGNAVADVDLRTTAQITVGCTYSVPLSVAVTNPDLYVLAGTYESNDGGLTGIKEFESPSYKILLKHKTVQVGTTYYTIEDALAQSGNATVRANTAFTGTNVASLAGYSKENGNYTVANGETLLLPYDAEGNYSNREGTEADFADSSKSKVDNNLVYNLSIADNITLTVNGTLNIGGIVGHKGTGLSAQTSGKYSQILMYNGSKIVLENAVMNVYGYIKTLSANTTANIEANGSTKISAPFVVYDYRGGTSTVGTYKDGLNIGDIISSALSPEIKISDPTISPFSVYDMPNIQASLRITHSATLIGLVDLYTSDPDQHNTADISVIAASNAVINLTGASSYAVTRYTPGSYDATRGGYTVNDSANGRTKIEIHGDANLGSMTLTMRVNLPILRDKVVNVSTAQVYFPIPWKYDIVIAEGTIAKTLG